MQKYFFLLFGFILSPSLVLAAPSFTLEDDQTFTQHQGLVELRSFIITDTIGGEITADFGIKISIPEKYPAILNMAYIQENIVVYGTAVDNARVAAKPEIAFYDKGKTLYIPVQENFQAGETLTVSRTWLKDIETSSGSEAPVFIYAEGMSVKSPKTLAAWSSSNDDSLAPDTPYNQTIEVLENGTVQLTWEDSYDGDMTQVVLLRGKNTPASGTPYLYIAKGEQKFIDTDVKIGDTMQYYVLATDGRNRSNLGAALEIIVAIPKMEEVQEVVPEEVQTPIDENTVEPTIEEKIEEELVSTETKEATRAKLKVQAEDIMKISHPLTRLQTLKAELKKYEVINRIWLMRYAIAYKEAKKQEFK